MVDLSSWSPPVGTLKKRKRGANTTQGVLVYVRWKLMGRVLYASTRTARTYRRSLAGVYTNGARLRNACASDLVFPMHPWGKKFCRPVRRWGGGGGLKNRSCSDLARRDSRPNPTVTPTLHGAWCRPGYRNESERCRCWRRYRRNSMTPTNAMRGQRRQKTMRMGLPHQQAQTGGTTSPRPLITTCRHPSRPRTL